MATKADPCDTIDNADKPCQGYNSTQPVLGQGGGLALVIHGDHHILDICPRRTSAAHKGQAKQCAGRKAQNAVKGASRPRCLRGRGWQRLRGHSLRRLRQLGTARRLSHKHETDGSNGKHTPAWATKA